MKILLALAFLLCATAANAQLYTSQGSNDSEPGDTMYRMPDGESRNITQDDEDDARERAMDAEREQPAPEWRATPLQSDDRGSDADIRAQIEMLNAMSRR